MLKFKLIGLAVMLKSLLVNTFNPAPNGFDKNSGEYKKTSIGRINGFLESSGLEVWNDSLLVTHNDSGGSGDLYLLDHAGEIVDTVILNLRNRDWEDITRDDDRNFYIGDFGNNSNQRKDLRVYKVGEGNAVGEIQYKFVDQKSFPPDKINMNYDMEAMLWYRDSLHLFSKNRGTNNTDHYALPTDSGVYSINSLSQIEIPNLITAADINPSGTMLALLSYGRIYLFKIAPDKDLLDQPYKVIPFIRGAQAEALVFIADDAMIISNETGKLFLVERKL